MSEDLSYPIGRFVWPKSVSAADRDHYIGIIASLPIRLREAVDGLTGDQINTPYRPGGWTVGQVVHHVPESHMNSYIRFKLALTEDQPIIKPYDEAAWARFDEVPATPVEVSICLLECLHTRWVNLLRGLDEADWKRQFRHPEVGAISLENNLALYAWHGDHHIAHITGLRARCGW